MGLPADVEDYDSRRYALEPRGSTSDENAVRLLNDFFCRFGHRVLKLDEHEIVDSNGPMAKAVRHYGDMTLYFDYDLDPNWGRAAKEAPITLNVYGPPKSIDQLVIQLRARLLPEVELVDYDDWLSNWREQRSDSSTTNNPSSPPHFPPQPD